MSKPQLKAVEGGAPKLPPGFVLSTRATGFMPKEPRVTHGKDGAIGINKAAMDAMGFEPEETVAIAVSKEHRAAVFVRDPKGWKLKKNPSGSGCRMHARKFWGEQGISNPPKAKDLDVREIMDGFWGWDL